MLRTAFLAGVSRVWTGWEQWCQQGLFTKDQDQDQDQDLCAKDKDQDKNNNSGWEWQATRPGFKGARTFNAGQRRDTRWSRHYK